MFVDDATQEQTPDGVQPVSAHPTVAARGSLVKPVAHPALVLLCNAVNLGLDVTNQSSMLLLCLLAFNLGAAHPSVGRRALDPN